jgi:hypothetical protein
VVAIISVLVLSPFLFKASDSGLNVTDISEKGTKFSVHNNGTTYAVLDLIIENATLKNGTTQTFYGEVWIKPVNGTVTIDLSKLLGYGNEKLPAGTSIRIVSWKGLYNTSTPVANQDLNISMQGWSNTYKPSVDDAMYNVSFKNLTVGKLPANVTDNTVMITDLNDLIHLDNNNEPLYEEEVLTVNADGSVSIVFVQTPALCSLMAHLF